MHNNLLQVNICYLATSMLHGMSHGYLFSPWTSISNPSDNVDHWNDMKISTSYPPKHTQEVRTWENDNLYVIYQVCWVCVRI